MTSTSSNANANAKMTEIEDPVEALAAIEKEMKKNLKKNLRRERCQAVSGIPLSGVTKWPRVCFLKKAGKPPG